MKTSFNSWATIVIAIIALVIAGATGAALQERSMSITQQKRAEVYRQIEDIIVKRNPSAAIKDFAGFPEFLIAESAKGGIDFRLVMAVIDLESEWLPDAVSPKGAIGLMQVMPKTGGDMSAKLKIESYRFAVLAKNGRYADLGSLGDPKTNVQIGIAYLAQQRDSFGMDGGKALRAYNRGPSKAALAWNHDRYAEEISLRFVSLAHKIPMFMLAAALPNPSVFLNDPPVKGKP